MNLYKASPKQGRTQDFLLGGGEFLVSALSSGCRKLLPYSSQMSMNSPFGLDCEEAKVSGSIASWETW